MSPLKVAKTFGGFLLYGGFLVIVFSIDKVATGLILKGRRRTIQQGNQQKKR